MDTAKIDLHLCAGYDGIGRGLELAGVEPPHGTIYVEIEAYACANLVAKIEEGALGPAVCHSDLKNFPYQDLAGHVRILTAGFPCQPFSSAGNREGTEDPRHLWPHIARGISQCRPEVVFCENVEGIISSKTSEGQSVLQYVLEDLERMDYRATAGIFSAEEVGAPHRRKRVFILGHSDSIDRRSPTEGRIYDTKAGRTSKNKNMAHSDNKGPQGSVQSHKQHEQQELRQSSEQYCLPSVFPSHCGEQQFRWEHPRTFESKLGRATDGVTFPVDRLRLLGNGVVPQTAARAWITLNERMKI